VLLDNRVFIIAEAGVNHNGNMNMAYQMIGVARNAGVDAVKFQNFKTELLAKRDLEKETYQKENSYDVESQFEMLKRLELSEGETISLKEYSEKAGLKFISTPYDRESVDLLERIGVDQFKVGSGEITDLPFLEYIAKKQKPMIISTGASYINEIEEAVEVISAYNKEIILLHCTSCYPTRLKDVNLDAMKTLMQIFEFPVGYSDHTTGIYVSVAAVAIGAKVIEKHFTLDKELSGPDHKASLNPDELKEFVAAIREIETAMGDYEKRPCDSEEETRLKGRRSILTKSRIRKGEVITEDLLITKRPGTGIPPKRLREIIGKRAKRDMEEDSLISLEDIEK